MTKIELTLKFATPGRSADKAFNDVPHTGYSTDTPGLAVCRKLRWSCDNYKNGEGTWAYKPAENWWQVIHIASGFQIEPRGIYLSRRKDALAAARNLGGLADWTLDAPQLAKVACRDKARAVFEQFRS